MANVAKPVLAHLTVGSSHTVVAELRVLVAPGRSGGFVAQGLEIDYVATAKTEEAVREQFTEGFVATVRSLIRRGRPLQSLFATRAPAEAIEAYFANERNDVFSCAIGAQFDDLPAQTKIPRHIAFVRANHYVAA